MRYILYMFSIFIISVSLFSGCMQNENALAAPETTTKSLFHTEDKKVLVQEDNIVVFTVLGEGIAPKNNYTKAQQKLLAKRAAVADAYRQLGEKLYGVKVNATDTVKDAALKSSEIVTTVDAVLRNSNITHVDYKKEIYTVAMSLSINKDRWLEKFSY